MWLFLVKRRTDAKKICSFFFHVDFMLAIDFRWWLREVLCFPAHEMCMFGVLLFHCFAMSLWSFEVKR